MEHMNAKPHLLALLVLCLNNLGGAAFAQAPTIVVNVSWAPDPFCGVYQGVNANCTGYKLYWGTQDGGPYPQSVPVFDVNQTTVQLTDVNGLQLDTLYYLVATQTNDSPPPWDESVFSAQASFYVPPDNQSPNSPNTIVITVTVN